MKRRTDTASAGVNDDTSPAHEKRFRFENKKPNYDYAFPKGSCIVRFSDVTNDGFNVVWIVENYVLIRKLELVDVPFAYGNALTFQVTNRYQGWYFDEPWACMLLNVASQRQSDGKYTILCPTAKEISEARANGEMQRLSTNGQHSNSRTLLHQKIMHLKQIKSRRRRGKLGAGAAGCSSAHFSDDEDDDLVGDELFV